MTVSFLYKASMAVPSLLLAMSAIAVTPGSDTMATIAHTTSLRQGDVITGAVPLAQPMHIVVALKMRNRETLDSFIANAAKSPAGGVAQPMSREAFLANHAPTQSEAQRVADYLTRSGFRNVEIAPNRLLVSADGNANAARSAFLTSLVGVKTREGRMAFANNDNAHIPQALKDSVLSVVGLQSVHQLHTFARQLDPQDTAAFFGVGHYPNEFSSVYGGTGVPTAAGVSVGIITSGSLTQTIADLNTFTAAHGFPTVVTQTVDTGGTSTDTSGTGEWDLDSQNIVGMAGGRVGKIIFYNEPDLTNPGLTANLNAVVAANAAKIINVSLGECELFAQEDGSQAADDQILATGVAQGQTFSVSTGDSGADECGDGGTTPSSPANSPYAMAISGTTLLTSSSSIWNGERGWSGSGGSASTFEPKPVWQNALVPGTKRVVADVSFDADPHSGAIVVYFGGLAQFGGTSLSAPIFAGMWARVIAVKGTGVGFAAPLIYALPASDFHDILIGNNRGSTAQRGYDFMTGRGSMILNTAINHIGH